MQIAAGTREQRHEEDRRRQYLHGHLGACVANEMEIDEPIRREEGEERKDKPRAQHEGHRDAEDAFRPPDILQRHALRRNDGNRNRHACLRDRHREEINRKRHLVKTDALAAQDARNKNPIQGTDDLDDKAGNRKDKRPLQERLAFARLLLK